ncbi:3-hydroxyacyl-CoA dehydrogenase NAD-binding domain-containing protein [Rhizobium sp. HT1-10]|uniref:3-hydroxyacyl-CoA dehydrogenase NAD-binding domain-containing protein n=1 Tax=Rhizobium sp. HT1-10 TaxID=3111638 RepID=UPI003C22A7B8
MPTLIFSASVSGETIDGVLVVTLDNPPVNALSSHVRAGIMAALDHAAATAMIKGIVITGAGRTFIGGADIREFGKPPVEPILPDVISHIEAFGKPVVAAVNGAALGGGCEILLACHGRVANPGASFGLPEVKLGLVPGAGGTQRLPRLIGTTNALDLIGTGRIAKAAEAAELGLVDSIDADERAAAVEMVHTLAGTPLRRTGELTVQPQEAAVIDQVAAKIIAKSRGQTAPREALRLVQLAASSSLPDGLAEERATFLRLRDSDQSAALRYVFFAERSAGKVDGLEGVQPRRIATIGIVGTGLMGAGIAAATLGAGYRVVGLEQTEEAALSGRARITSLLEKAVGLGRLDAEGLAGQLGRLTVTSDSDALADADLVIEAVFDDLAVKAALFQRLDAIVREDTILATNTSYLDPDTIAAATRHPSRVVGLHFFSPANIMRLVEVVNCAATAPDALATALAFAKRLGKLPVVCGVTEGFIGNSVFSAYRREAEFMLEDGALPHEIDAALEAYGFPMGLFAVYDMAGLEIAWARRKRQAASRDPIARYVEIADKLCEAGRFGQKAGRGWYDYTGGKRSVDPEVTALIETVRAEKGIESRSFSSDEIVSRLVKAMADEGNALLERGIAARSSDIDLVMINGYGFPSYRGGPMFLSGRR